jgi:hypothetical protein
LQEGCDHVENKVHKAGPAPAVSVVTVDGWRRISSKPVITVESADTIVHNKLGFSKVMSKQLSPELSNIRRKDMTSVYYFTSESKCSSVWWKHKFTCTENSQDHDISKQGDGHHILGCLTAQRCFIYPKMHSLFEMWIALI